MYGSFRQRSGVTAMEREVRIRMMGDLLVCAGEKTYDTLPGKSRTDRVMSGYRRRNLPSA